MATARTFEYGGFGTASVETVVQIKRSKGFESPQDVLGFAEGGADMGLKLRWDSPSHLIAVYKGAPELLYFQVVKTSGLDISVENISTAQDLHPSARP